MNSSVVGAPGAGGHRLRLPQRAAAIVATANSKTAIARVRPTRLAMVRQASVSLRLGIVRPTELAPAAAGGNASMAEETRAAACLSPSAGRRSAHLARDPMWHR